MAMPRDNSPNLTGLPAIQASVTYAARRNNLLLRSLA
jgi:hypothetical protein